MTRSKAIKARVSTSKARQRTRPVRTKDRMPTATLASELESARRAAAPNAEDKVIGETPSVSAKTLSAMAKSFTPTTMVVKQGRFQLWEGKNKTLDVPQTSENAVILLRLVMALQAEQSLMPAHKKKVEAPTELGIKNPGDDLREVVLTAAARLLERTRPKDRDLVNEVYLATLLELKQRSKHDPKLKGRLERKSRPVSRRYVRIVMSGVRTDYPGVELEEALGIALRQARSASQN